MLFLCLFNNQRRVVLDKKYFDMYTDECATNKLIECLLKKSICGFRGDPKTYIKKIKSYSRPVLSYGDPIIFSTEDPDIQKIISKYEIIWNKAFSSSERKKCNPNPEKIGTGLKTILEGTKDASKREALQNALKTGNLFRSASLSKMISYELDQISRIYSDEEKISLEMIQSEIRNFDFESAYTEFMEFDESNLHFKTSSRKQRVKGAVHQILLNDPYFKHVKKRQESFKETFDDTYEQMRKDYPLMCDDSLVRKLVEHYGKD